MVAEFWVIDASSAEVTPYRNTLGAHSFEDYRALLEAAGFVDVEIMPARGKEEFEEVDYHPMLLGAAQENSRESQSYSWPSVVGPISRVNCSRIRRSNRSFRSNSSLSVENESAAGR